MDWFGFHRSIPALVRGIDHPPMSGVGTNSDLKAMDGTRTPAHVGGGTSLLTTHAIAEIAGSRCNGGIQLMVSRIIAKDWH